MKKLPVALLLLLFCSVAAVSWLSAQTSATAPPAHPVLVVQSTPGGAQVYVDDELLGTTSPEGLLNISTLKPGKHMLRLSLGGNTYEQGQLTLVAGKSLTKKVTLPAQNTANTTADGGPSLDNTAAWLKDNIVQYGGWNRNVQGDITVLSFTAVNFTNCNFEIDEKIISLSATGEDTASVYKMKLQDLDPSVSVQKSPDPVGYFDTGVHTLGKKNVIVGQSVNTNRIPGIFDTAILPFRDEDIANRVARALSHAIKLCQMQHLEPF